jgi:hypothetical protein
MSSFQDLYGKKLNTPVSWDNLTDTTVIGPKLLKEIKEKMVKIKHNLKVAQDMQNSYVDNRITNREFKFGKNVF